MVYTSSTLFHDTKGSHVKTTPRVHRALRYIHLTLVTAYIRSSLEVNVTQLPPEQ